MFEISFNRSKDRVDLESLAVSSPDVDIAPIEDLLAHLRGHPCTRASPASRTWWTT